LSACKGPAAGVPADEAPELATVNGAPPALEATGVNAGVPAGTGACRVDPAAGVPPPGWGQPAVDAVPPAGARAGPSLICRRRLLSGTGGGVPPPARAAGLGNEWMAGSGGTPPAGSVEAAAVAAGLPGAAGAAAPAVDGATDGAELLTSGS